jgi:hypothetical protein
MTALTNIGSRPQPNFDKTTQVDAPKSLNIPFDYALNEFYKIVEQRFQS